MEAAGIDYQAILAASKEKTVTARRPRGYWDEPKILAAIRERMNAGKPLNSLAVQLDDGSLAAAAVRHLGSWEQAIETATGLNYEDIRLVDEWDKEKVIDAIKERYGSWVKARASALGTEPRRLRR